MRWISDLTSRLGLDAAPHLKKLIVGVIGMTVLLLGLALIVLPGPAIVVIPIGLAILATEFAWARHLIARGRDLLARAGIKMPDPDENKS